MIDGENETFEYFINGQTGKFDEGGTTFAEEDVVVEGTTKGIDQVYE